MVYHFLHAQTNHVSTMSLELFHTHLGHAYFPVLANVKDIYVPFSKIISHCDIFLRAKQTRDKFHSSTTNAIALFDLIHCDIWGSYKNLLVVPLTSYFS